MSISVQELPKTELHVHLEGTIDPSTLRELNPAISDADIEERYAFSDFGAFLKNFGWIAGHIQQPRDYGLVAKRLLERLAMENVRYVEITLSAGVALWRGHDLSEIHEALREATAHSPVECYWIWDAVRQWDIALAERVVEMAAARVNDGVIAFGLGGDETKTPATEFAAIFRYAREHGLRLLCHAGEVTGPQSIWNALDVGAERIGHGIACVDDPLLMRHLANHSIPLEICIASNLQTGAAARFPQYPLMKILDAGVPVTLHTDDPGMFRTSLTREYETARAMGVSDLQLREIAVNGFQYAFRWPRPYPAPDGA